jgi:hypothetical protein
MYFKIFTKVAVRRLTQVAEKLISHSQTAFIPKRNILEGAVILHETIHELHRKKMNGVILKIEFKKAYEKVKRGFLQQTLRIKGFSKNSANGFLNLLLGSVGIKVRVFYNVYNQRQRYLLRCILVDQYQISKDQILKLLIY